MVVKSERVKEALIKFVLYPFQKYYFGFDIKKKFLPLIVVHGRSCMRVRICSLFMDFLWLGGDLQCLEANALVC